MGQYSSSIRMGRLTQLAILLAIFSLAAGDLLRHSARRGRGGRRLRNRAGRQDDGDVPEVQGGVDFSGCVEDPDSGLCCVEKEETVKTLQKDPILECTPKIVKSLSNNKLSMKPFKSVTNLWKRSAMDKDPR